MRGNSSKSSCTYFGGDFLSRGSFIHSILTYTNSTRQIFIHVAQPLGGTHRGDPSPYRDLSPCCSERV